MGKHSSVSVSVTMKMKVTVCFGNVRVIVPCPNEEMLVRDLIHQATLRYKKAAGKGPESWVVVHKVKSQSDGGILDPDDKLVDVADDREQIMAIYEEDNDGMPSLQHNAGDGTSASSVGTNSPDIFQGSDHKFQPFTRTDIEITGEELSSGLNGGTGSSNGGVTLQVRRGSEPALNRLSPVHLSPPDPSKRWSAAPIIDEDIDELNQRKVKNPTSTTTASSATDKEQKQNQNSHNSSTTPTNNSINNNSALSNSYNNNSSSRENSVISVATSNSNSTTTMAVHHYQKKSGSSSGSSSAIPNSNNSANSKIQQQRTVINNNSASAKVNKANSSGSNSGSNGGAASVAALNSNSNTSNSPGTMTTTTNGNISHFSNQRNGVGVSANPNQFNQQQQQPPPTLRDPPAPSRFNRDYHRLSMQILGDGGAKWADAADRALCLSLRKEPLGANASPETPDDSSPPPHFSSPNYNNHQNQAETGEIMGTGKISQEASDHGNSRFVTGEKHEVKHTRFNLNEQDEHEEEEEQAMDLVLRYEAGPLGIHVVPEHNSSAKNQGLIVQGVEPGGRIDRDGRLQAQDKIIEINGHSLIGVPFQKAQELFRDGLHTPELQLRIIKNVVNQSILLQNDVPFGNQKFNNGEQEEKENSMVQSHEKIVGDAKVATVSPTKKMPLQAVPLTRPCTTTTALISSNTRKIGRKYEIDLQKGPQGLGFSITTRDNPAGGNCPIYIKNILPTGAAIDDGRLRPGDRLLEVNGIEITGKSQSEAVSILRNIPQGGIVKLVVSRQERVDLSPKLPRQIPPEKVSDDVTPVPWSEREVLTLDIPVLDTEKAGLGISVKGKTTAAQRGNMIDMGIYIKSVIHGGAASRDGRLKSNDQLLSINGVSLLDRSNTDAMETLRKTMTQDGPKPKPGFITLNIARRVPSSSAPTTDISGCGSSASGDEIDSWSSRNMSVCVDGNQPDTHKNLFVADIISSTGPENVSAFQPAYNYMQQQELQQQQTSPQNHMAKHSQSPSPNSNKPNENHRSSHHSRSSSLRRVEDVNRRVDERHRQGSASPFGRNSLDLPRNPVLDRLTGKNNNAAVRNESYYRATNETWNATLIQSMMGGGRGALDGQGRSQTISSVQSPKEDMILVEDDYSAPQKPPRRSRSSTPEDALKSSMRRPSTSSEIPTPIVSPNGEMVIPSDATYASQTSLEDAGGFSRDAFGRQSMSEKRHASLDAKSTDTYQRNKKLREERERQRQMQIQQEMMNDHKRAEQLARERNLQDQLARRGVKRPFSSSTEDDLAIRSSLTSINQGQGRTQSPPLVHSPDCQTQNVTRRRGIGDQILQLLHHWGHKQTHRTDVVGLPRVNSADSLVDALKQPGGLQMTEPNEGNFKGSKKDIGPSLGMKKSSSLESLQTMVQEIQIQEDVKSGYGPARAGPGAVRVVRGRGCNESFRQAVDRSYEAPLGELNNQMETLAEEETESCISGNTLRHSQRQRHQQQFAEGEMDPDNVYGKNKAPPPAKSKKPGLFRGLGSMFRFGRHRKSAGASSSLSAVEMKKQQAEFARLEKEESEHLEREKARLAAHNEQMRIQEQYRRLVEKQHKENGGDRNNPAYGMTVSIASTNGGNYVQGYPNPNHNQQGNLVVLPGNSNGSNTNSNSMRIKHHSNRKSMESRERERDRDINGNANPNHLRSASYDVYNEMTRPGSRVGFVDPKKYSHYINYEEIRHHLNDNISKGNGNGKLTEEQLRQMRLTVVEQRKKAILESRRHQQHYHSQRREHPRERQERPVSNFYEYESVQAAMHPQGAPPNRQGPPHGQGQPIYGVNGFSPSQMQQQNKANNNNGVTLPSPSTLPLPVNLHQISPSQFQAVPSGVSHSRLQFGNEGGGRSTATLQHISPQQQNSQQQQKQKQNSLPRRTQKELVQIPQNPATNHRHPAQQQQFLSQQQLPGRYTIAHPSNSQSQPQNFRTLAPPQQSSTSRISSHLNHNHHNHPNGVHHRNSSTTLGSKV